MNQPTTDRFDLATRLDASTASLSERIRSLPPRVRLPIALPALGLSVYFGVTNTGPWAWGLRASEGSRLTALLVDLVVCVVPAIALLLVVASRRRSSVGGVPVTAGAPIRIENTRVVAEPLRGYGDKSGEHERIERGRYGAWIYVVFGFLIESAILGFPLGFLLVLVSGGLGAPGGTDVTVYTLGMLVLGPLAAYLVFRDRFRTIEAFSSRYCSGIVNVSLLYVPVLVVFYANYRALLKLRGR